MGGYEAAITFLKTQDLEGTSRFYTEVVGLELALDQGTCRIFRVRAGAYIGFCVKEGAPVTEEVI